MAQLLERFDVILLPPNTVHSIMVLCGLADNDQPNPNPDNIGSTAERVATDVFMDNFEKCLLMSFTDLETDLTLLSKLPVNPIFITSGARTKLKAFVEWTKYCFHFGFHPEETLFPVHESLEIVRQAGRLADFVKRSKFMATTATPGPFKANMDWSSWSQLLVNFLRQIPSAEGYPLSYILRDEDEPFYDPNAGFDAMQISIRALPLNGKSFEADTLQVHTYIQTFIAGNVKAESAITTHRAQPCGRTDWKSLRAVYEGVGAFKIELMEAERILDTMFYHSEKPNGINWSTFSLKLTKAFSDVNNSCAPGTVAWDDQRKIKHLLKRTSTAPALQGVNTQITRELGDPTCRLTFAQVLSQMQNVITLAPKSGGRVIQSANSGRNGPPNGGRNGGRGNGGGRNQATRGGNGRGGNGGRGNGAVRSRNHPDAYNITLTNGKVISAHPSYSFTTEEMSKMHPVDKQAIFAKRKEYRESRGINAASTQGGTQAQTQIGWPAIQVPAGADASSVISAVTQQLSQAIAQVGTTMGGRNEEASRRGNRNISHMYSTRNIDTTDRHVRSVRNVAPKPNITAPNECDSNADTCCAGTNFIIMQYSGRTADVYPYDSSYEPIRGVPIVSAATAWTNPNTGETVILIIHECLYYGTTLGHTLWNPNQLRHNGVQVHDNPYDTAPTRMSIIADDVIIPLQSVGTKIQFTTHSPSERELQNCRHVDLTSINEWNPKEVILGAVCTDHGYHHEVVPDLSPFISDSLLHDLDPALVELKERALSEIRVSLPSCTPSSH